MKKFTAILAALTALFVLFAGCSGKYGGNYYPGYNEMFEENGDANYDYEQVIEQPFYETAKQSKHFFMLDRNTANYSMIRYQINQNMKVSPDSVRAEELINYFDYDYAAPETGENIKTSTFLFPCPWNEEHYLLNIGIRTENIKIDAQAANYVFLIDVSGSMQGTDRIDLVKTSLKTLVENLSENDRIAIVTYASGVKTVLDSTPADEKGKQKILDKIDDLKAGGSTFGSGGIDRAYSIAYDHRIVNGNNRVILMSDGDFNVGVTDGGELSSVISEKAQSGIYLSVFGFGMGNTRDTILEKLARHGNGNYAYIDNETEAKKVFEKDIAGMLITVAKDAKAGVTFNSETVKSYRPVGYDTKLISEEQFNDPDTDAGEIGSNLCVNALYEIELYEGVEPETRLADVEIRYKDADAQNTDKTETNFINFLPNPTDDTSFISCVAEFALVLRNSEYKGNANLQSVLTRLEGLSEYLAADELKAEFKTIVETAIRSELYS